MPWGINIWPSEDSSEEEENEPWTLFGWIASLLQSKNDEDTEKENSTYESSIYDEDFPGWWVEAQEPSTSQSYIPTPSQLLKLYTMYNLGGLNLLGITGAAFAGDKILMGNFGREKHYLALSALYGTIASNILSQIWSKESELSEAEQYFYSTLVIGVKGSMIGWGKDVFNLSLNFTDNLIAAKNIASLIDETGYIQKLSDEFDKGIAQGAKFVLYNPSILANPLIMRLAAIEAMELAKVFFLEKYFPYTPTGTLALFLATEKTGITYEAIAGPIFSVFVRQMADIGYNAASEKLKGDLKKLISIEVARIIFEKGDPQTILRTEDAKDLGYNYEKLLDNIISDLSKINRELVVPKPIGLSLGEIFSKYPSLLLSKEFIEHFFGVWEIQKGAKAITSYFVGSVAEEKDEFLKTEPVKMSGFGRVNFVVTPDTYASGHMHNIMKLKAGSITCELLEKYQNRPNKRSPNELSNQDKVVEAIFKLLKEGVYSLLYIAQLKWLGIESSTITDAEHKIGLISEMVTPNVQNPYLYYNPKEIGATLQKIMRKTEDNIAKVALSVDGNLHLSHYHLYSTQSEGHKALDIKIEALVIEKGKVTALNGRNGSGKTTLLNSVAGCLPAAFDSEGTILLPTIDGEKPVPIIYSGSEIFNPPGCTLFEQITFRLPSKYRREHEDQLVTQIKEISQELGPSTDDIISKLDQKNVDLSTGQGCIVLTIGALLHKKYLQEVENVSEVVLIFDETFPNIDISTQDAIFKLIRSMCREDVVIAVQHGAERMKYKPGDKTGFFDEIIDITQYRSYHGADSAIISKLDQKNVDLSTGQGCIVLTIGALLHSQGCIALTIGALLQEKYLQELENVWAVVLIVDETFPNIDISTQHAIFKLIRSICREDILIVVQHGAERMPYNSYDVNEITDITQGRLDQGADLSGADSPESVEDMG